MEDNKNWPCEGDQAIFNGELFVYLGGEWKT